MISTPRKRRCADLSLTPDILPGAAPIVRKHYLLNGSLSLYQKDYAMVRQKTNQAIKNLVEPRRAQILFEYDDSSIIVLDKNVSGLELLKKQTLEYFFILFGKPTKAECSEWLIDEIMNRCALNKEAKRCTLRTLGEIRASYDDGVKYDQKASRKTHGVKAIFTDDNEDGKRLIGFFRDKMPIPQATFMINTIRKMRGDKDVSMTTVQAFVEKSKYADRYLVKTRQQGRSDAESDWAKARVIFLTEIIERFRVGDNTIPSLAIDFKNWDDNILKPLWNASIIVYDERHRNIQSGPPNKYLVNVCVDEFGEPTTEDAGGTFPPEYYRIAFKYPSQGRFCFAAALTETIDGTLTGVKPPIFDYTGKNIVTLKTWNGLMSIEFAQKVNEGEKKTPTGRESVWKGGYLKRYGMDEGTKLCSEFVGRKNVKVIDLIDYIWDTAVAHFDGTVYQDCFSIYHDHLVLMWSKEGIDHMKNIGMWDHIIKVSKPNNNAIHARYRNSVPGDSPEMCKGLDCYGFAHSAAAELFHIILTWNLADNDPKKFRVNTPKNVSSTMRRIWESVAPTSEQLVKDLTDWRRTAMIIVQNKGCVVRGEAFRHGHRALRVDGEGLMKNKSRSNERKATLKGKIIHPDALGSYDRILAGVGGVKKVIEVVELGEQQEYLQRQAQEDREEIASDDEEGKIFCYTKSCLCFLLIYIFSYITG